MSKTHGKKQKPVAPAAAAAPDFWEKLVTPRALAIAFAAAVLLFYYKPLFDSAASIQWDAVDVHYSAQKYFADHLLSGRLPFWTPYVFSGFPFLADPQVGAWYPLNWPFFLMGVTARAIQWELAMHCLLALAGGYLLAREMFASRAAAVFAGVFFAFSGFFAGNSSHIGGFQAAALLPWLLWAGRRAVASVRWLPALSAAAGCVVLTGHFQMALYAFSALALFLMAELIERRESLRPVLVALVCAAVSALALSAVMVLPGLELTGQSERAGVEFAQSQDGILQPAALMTIVSPDHYGAVDGQNYTGPADITQFYFYQGLLLLPLAVWGVAVSRRRWLPLALVVPAIWYALGRTFGLYSLVSLLPGFKSIRAPVNVWFVAALGLALLAAAGVEALRTRFRSPWIPVALLLITGADVYYWNMDHNALAYARTSFQEQYGMAEDRFKSVAQAATGDPLHRLYAPFDSPGFGPLNGSLDNRIEVTFGYNPLALRRYSQYLEAAKNNPRLLDSLSVTAQLNAADGRFAPNPSAMPRVFAPDTATPVRSREEAGARLASLDPSRETVVEGLPSTMPANGAAKVQITGYEGDAYRVRYQADRPTLLRIAAPYFPGWQAEVDGRAADVMPADLALMAVAVPAGSHELALRYHSARFAAGAAISLLSWLAVIGGCVGSWRSGTKKTGEPAGPPA